MAQMSENSRSEEMHNRRTLIRLAVAAVAILLAGMPALAATDPSVSCSTGEGGDATWTVWVNTTGGGPVDANGTYSSLKYTVTGSPAPDHVAILAGIGMTVVGPGSQTYAPFVGDPVTELGKLTGHQQAGKVNPSDAVRDFTVNVSPARKLALSTVVVKKGSKIGACVILAPGNDATQTTSTSCVQSCGNFDPFQSVRSEEIFKFKGCEVKFTFDPATGAVLTFEVGGTGESGHLCTQKDGEISDLLLDANTGDLANNPQIKFGDGWIGSGGGSCTTRFIGGRYYTCCE
jgi:hypothetical protein